MKIIIFIIIACTLFVAWSLCIVGASADEQLEMIYAKDLERKENSMDNTYAPTENKEQEKIKVESIDIVVTGGERKSEWIPIGERLPEAGNISWYLSPMKVFHFRILQYMKLIRMEMEYFIRRIRLFRIH